MRYIFLLSLFFFFGQLKAIEFHSTETQSGIKFWLIEDKSLPLVSMSFVFKGGSKLDPFGKEGLSNLMTSLLDEGTENFTGSKFKLFLKENGIKISYSTTKERIDGTFQVIKSQMQQGFWALNETINKAIFGIDEIERVKTQIEASIKFDQSDISSIASDKFNEKFFKNKKMGRKIKGSIKSLNKISRSDILEFYKSSFTKSNLIIGIAGDVSPSLAKKYVEYVFGNLPKGTNNNDEKKSNFLSKGESVFNIETPQTTVVFGQRGLNREHKDFFAARIVNYVLGGGGFQSRLYKEIREKNGLVYSIYSYLLPYETFGVIMGGFQTRNENVWETIEKVKNEWSKIKSLGITKNELESAKTYYKGSFSRNFTSTLSIASLLKTVQYYNLGDDYFEKRNSKIDNLKLDYVNKVANDLFDSETLFFMIVGEPKFK